MVRIQRQSRKTFAVALAILGALGGCFTSEKPYTHYLLDPEVEVQKQLLDKETDRPLATPPPGSDRTIKSRWNNGQVYTEVEIPVLASGQRIVIEHEATRPDQKKPGPSVVMASPSASDTSHQVLHNAYLARGLQENTKAPEVSLSQARIRIDQTVRGKNYALALQMLEKVLARYPSHPEFLRAKGSVLLLLGEREKALETYEAAQDIEFDPSVERKLKELEP